MNESILSDLVTKYCQCESYSDSDLVTVRVDSVTNRWNRDNCLRFRNLFMRPMYYQGRIGMEFSDQVIYRYLVCDGDTTRLLKGSDENFEAAFVLNDIESAALQVAGISLGVVPFILDLLLPGGIKVLKNSIHQIESFESLSDTAVEGVECRHIRGSTGSVELELWIDARLGHVVTLFEKKAEDGSSRDFRVRQMELMAEASKDPAEELEKIPREKLSYLTEFHFESVVFNDSMTIDSIIDVESALSGKL